MRAKALLLLGLALLMVGCYETPMPACTFQCGAGGQCPSGYTCSAVDNICKRDDVAADHMCEGLVLADAAVDNDASVTPDAPVPDAAVNDASPFDAATPDAMVDATIPTPDAMVDAPPAAVCGNGTQEGGEACDDNNDNACGSCNMGCTAAQTPAAATGSITTVAAAQIVASETFTINDGINTPTVFTYTTSGSPPMIDLSAATTADDVKTATINAINAMSATLLVTASDGGAGVVTVTHTRLSSLGNQAITETVTDAGFMVSGLSGGVAGDCPGATGCSGNDDCASGTCTANVCD